MPVREFVQKLVAARLAADVLGVPTLVIARTDADAARLLLSDVDPRDEAFLEGGRTEEGYYRYRGGIEAAISRELLPMLLTPICCGAKPLYRIWSRHGGLPKPLSPQTAGLL